jgi:type IV secretory pathway VirJ component
MRHRTVLFLTIAACLAAPVLRRALATESIPPAVAELPIHEVPATSGGGDLLAVLVSGDGGWAHTDRVLSERLAQRGVPVAGLNSVRYFWTKRTPDECGRALETMLRHYLKAWGKTRVLLIGFSRGAFVVPFMASRLPQDLRERVALVALLSPGTLIDFEFHIKDWFGGAGRDQVPVAPEVEKLRGLRLLCSYGTDDKDAAKLCTGLSPGLAIVVPQQGGHHFEESYADVADQLLREAH